MQLRELSFGFEIGHKRPFIVLFREPWTKICTFIDDMGRSKTFDFEEEEDPQDEIRGLRIMVGAHVRSDQLELVLDGAFNYEAVIYFTQDCLFLGEKMKASAIKFH